MVGTHLSSVPSTFNGQLTAVYCNSNSGGFDILFWPTWKDRQRVHMVVTLNVVGAERRSSVRAVGLSISLAPDNIKIKSRRE